MIKDLFIGLILIGVIVGCGGSDGEPGPQGFSALIETTTLSSGDTDCPNGGTQIDTGIDNGDGEGIAGNGSLESGEIDDTELICSGAEGPSGGNDAGNSFYFEETFNEQGAKVGYLGLTRLNINNQMPDDQIDVGSIKVIVDNTATYTVQRSLIKFDSISQVIQAETTSNFKLNMAVLYVLSINSSVNELEGIDYTYVGVHAIRQTFAGNAIPVYDPATVSWNFANPSQLWPVPGIFESQVPADDDRKRIDKPTRGGFPSQWHAFLLDKDAVSKWIESDAENRGISVAILEADGLFGFVSARASLEFVQPILFIDAEENPSGGRVLQISDQQYRDRWEAMSEEEKLIPLFKYLKSK